jgi:hypothetical protein
MVLVQGVPAGYSVSPGDAHTRAVGGHTQGCPRLALELDDDGADVLRAAKGEHDIALDEVQVGVEFGRVVQNDAY